MPRKLSERLIYMRADRPDEWLMDEFAKEAARLEAVEEKFSASNSAMDAIAEISRHYAEAETSWEFYDWYGTNRQRLNAVLAQQHQ